MEKGLNHCEGMFGCSWSELGQNRGEVGFVSRLQEMASKVPDNCDQIRDWGLRDWAKGQLLRTCPQEYAQMLSRVEAQQREMRKQDEKEEAAFEALRYYASGEALGMQEGWYHCEGMFGCFWGCYIRADYLREKALRPAARTLAQQVPDDCGRMVLNFRAKELLKTRWPEEYMEMERRVKEVMERRRVYGLRNATSSASSSGLTALTAEQRAETRERPEGFRLQGFLPPT